MEGVNLKKILLLVAFTALSVAIGFLIYYLFFKSKAPITPPNNLVIYCETNNGVVKNENCCFDEEKACCPLQDFFDGKCVGEGFPPPGQRIPPEKVIPATTTPILPIIPTPPAIQPSENATGGVTQTTTITNSPSLAPTLSKDGNSVQYYNENDGRFYRVNNEGEAELLTDQIFYNVDNIVWSPNKNKAILEYPDGSNILYDFDSKKQISFPKHWTDFDFSPKGESIVMKSIGLDPSNRWLAVTNEDGSQVTPIESLGENGDTVYNSWSPNNQTIAMYTNGVDFNRQEVFFVGLNGENFKSTIIEGRGFQPQWSPQGDKLLYSVYSSDNGMKPNLWIVNAQGNSIGSGRSSLHVETWANKCTFSDNYYVYCAVPDSLEEGAGLFPELAANTKDNLYQIDTRTGIKKLVAIPEGVTNISNLMVSKNNDYLYFKDNQNQNLYKINLQ